MTTSQDTNNDLLTKIWGPHFWISLHSVTFGFPDKPTSIQKTQYKKYFELVGDVLPCHYCRNSYKKFISYGSTKLTDKVFENKNSLTKWLYDIHNAVNRKLSVDYGVSYDDVVKKYETYKSDCNTHIDQDNDIGCVIPSVMNTTPITDIKDVLLISICIAEQFIEYAKMRNISVDDLKLFNIISDNNFKISYDNNIWQKRNKECIEIINYMKNNKIHSIEKNGKWKGLPTIEELKLILRLCSNMNTEMLSNLIKKLPNKKNNTKIYKLIRNKF